MASDAAEDLLRQSARARSQVRRHLFMAAAIGAVLAEEPIVVGGTAEEFWTEDAYHPTDLDLCFPLTNASTKRLRGAGFVRDGRHWSHPAVRTVAIEFPDDAIDGDMGRTHAVRIGRGIARVIGLDDLYLDRLRQATANPIESSREYNSALAVVAARYEDLDRRYIEERLQVMKKSGEWDTAQEMRRIDARINRVVRRRLAET